MLFDYSKLQGRIVEKFGTRRAFAAALSMTDVALSNRLNGKVPFNTKDIYRMCEPELLNIPPEEMHDYFFTPKVRCL